MGTAEPKTARLCSLRTPYLLKTVPWAATGKTYKHGQYKSYLQSLCKIRRNIIALGYCVGQGARRFDLTHLVLLISSANVQEKASNKTGTWDTLYTSLM